MDRKRKLERYHYAAWIDDIEEKKSLELITWRNMRENAMNIEQKEYADFWSHITLKTMFKVLKEEINDSAEDYEDGCGGLCELLVKVCGGFLLYFLFPLYLLSKVLMLIYPFIIAMIFFFIESWDKNELPMFQIIMLMIYFVMIIIVIIFGVPTFRLLFWLWHIAPGDESIIIHRFDVERIEKYYDELMLVPFIQNLVIQKFGNDVGLLIVEYFKSINLKLEEQEINPQPFQLRGIL